MAAEATMYTVLTGYGPLTLLVGTDIYVGTWDQGAGFPLVLAIRLPGGRKDQAVTAKVVARLVPFQIEAVAETESAARNVADQIEAALEASAPASFADVVFRSDHYRHEQDAGLHRYLVEVDVLEAA